MSDIFFDPVKTAVVAIDLQQGVVSLPLAPHSGQEVAMRTARIADTLRGKGGLVVWVRVTTSAGGADALKPYVEPAPPAFNPPPNWADLVPDLHVQPEDVVITKRQWGAFYGTELDLQLRRRKIETIILTGISTHIGVESTARDAYERGFNQIFVVDAMSATGDGHATPVKSIFPRIGVLRTTDELLAQLSSNAV